MKAECDRHMGKGRVEWSGGVRGVGGSWERCEVESKTLELPWFHCERDSAESVDNACPLRRGMPKTMTSSSSSPSSYSLLSCYHRN